LSIRVGLLNGRRDIISLRHCLAPPREALDLARTEKVPWAILAMTSAALKNAIPESLHFPPLTRLKIAVHPCTAGNAE
jgi:hypothetical protein